MHRIALTLAAVLALTCACSRNIQNKEAVKQAVVEYLNARQAKTGLDMSAMDVDVLGMSFEQNQAVATVYFKLKSGDGGMKLEYDLDRKSDHWVVRGIRSSSGPHGSDGTGPGADTGNAPSLPANHPQLDGTATQAPPLTDPAAPLPAGHPPIGTKK